MTDLVESKIVESEISKFKELFKDNPIKFIQEGTWLSAIINKVLFEHALEVNAEYFRKKYVGLSKDQIAKQMINLTSYYSAIAGGIAASTMTAAELTAIKKSKASFVIGASSLICEITYIAYLQLKLIYDISVLYNIEIDINDPEDLLQILWYGLGINIWQHVTNVSLHATTRSTTYLSRKLLRSGLRKSMVNIATRYGGKKLASKITEKSLMKLIVPVINIPLAGVVNWGFTNSIGKRAQKSFKSKSAFLSIMKNMPEINRHDQLLIVAIIFQVGVSDQDLSKISKIIEMQNAIVKWLCINNDEEKIIDDLVDLNFEEFCNKLSCIDNEEVKNSLLDATIYSHLICDSKNNDKIIKISKTLNINFDDINFTKYKQRLG